MGAKPDKSAVAAYRHADHKRPVTRRDFLAQGFVAGVGSLMVPSALSLLTHPRPAYAQALDCGVTAGGAGKIPFLCFDLAGGANVAGSNVMVGGPGGQLDFLPAEGYQKLGLPAGMLPGLPGQLNTELGLAFHSDSAFLRGILSKTSDDTRSRVNGSVICARSENDTGNNPHNPMYGIYRAGADGDLVTLIGTESTESGGRSMAPTSMIDPTVRPTKVSKSRDARGLVDTGKLIDLLDQNDAASVMAAMEGMSELKVQKMALAPEIKDLMNCAYVQSTDLVARYGDPGLLDPLQDADIVGAGDSIFTGAELEQSALRKTAAVMKLVVGGFAGAGTLEFGGYDYHDGTRATGEVKDFEAGQAMGAALEYAARRGQQLMLYVFSDGSLDSDGDVDNSADGRGKLSWRGDNSSTASVFILVYDPDNRPALTSPAAAQLGYFRPTGSLETAASRASNNVVQLAQTVVLNYMALHDDVGRFDAVLPEHGLGAGADLDSLIAFQPIR